MPGLPPHELVRFLPFVIYRIVLGIALFALIGAGVLGPRAAESAG
ncbi:UDP pyrophosphate phosphatase [Streptomyces benahoarensis]|uniref:UDP pyrophosphate phosphatase n=1 Tax=Streptomyces benahoarensis TaxID=2595054 RepID=A0A553YGL9_9ACTN|nr:UDP pyrophosphate phosphatase [Streptomyces benahoarensis]TSB28349.1 UDP pyrophosphate phosphatase [Streptomyces benahoarensis]